MPPGRRDDEGAIPRVLRPAVASGASPCGSSTKRPSVVARCPHQGVATPAMAGMTEVVWSATTPDGDAIARVWNDAQCVMSGLARGDSIRAGMWPLQLSYGDACADAVRLIPRPPGLGRTGRATGRATGISGVSAALRTPVTSAPPAPRLRWRQPCRSEGADARGEGGTTAAPGVQPYSWNESGSEGDKPEGGGPRIEPNRTSGEGRRGDREKSGAKRICEIGGE